MNNFEFRLNNFHYKLIYGPKKISITGERLKLSLKGNSCNRHILNDFEKEVASVLGKLDRKADGKQDSFKVISGSRSLFGKRNSPFKKYFIGLPREIQRMKLESKYLCTNS